MTFATKEALLLPRGDVRPPLQTVCEISGAGPHLGGSDPQTHNSYFDPLNSSVNSEFYVVLKIYGGLPASSMCKFWGFSGPHFTSYGGPNIF